MTKTLLPLLFFALPFVGNAQVDNYCLRLSDQGSVNCGIMPELDAVSNYSLQFWFNADEWNKNSSLLSCGESLQVKLGDTNQLDFVLGNDSFSAKNSTLMPNRWIQITLIVENGSLKVMANKKVIAEQKGNFNLPKHNTGQFTIGGHYNGRIDEVRVWNNVLSSKFNYFINNTLNKWVPQLDDLVAYYKFDQDLCPNIVDYKPLFKSSEYNHHGVFSSTDAQREKVTDNKGLPYLLMGAYTDNSRFWDRTIEKDLYLLSNDLIILGIESYPDGHLKYTSTNDHATLEGGIEYIDNFEGRQGVASFDGTGKLITTTDVLTPVLNASGKTGQGYTFETWLYLDEWTPGAFLFNKMADEKHGFAICLGEEEKHQVIVNVNGNKYVNESPLTIGKWTHVAITTNAGGSPRLTFMFAYDGKAKWANNALSSESTDYTPVGMENCVAVIGDGLKGKMDQTVIWNTKYPIETIRYHMQKLPMPSFTVNQDAGIMGNGSAYYSFDKENNIGWDSYSQDQWKNIMLSAYEGYRGYQVRISVKSHQGWQSTIVSSKRRKIFAADLAKLSEGYDGVELDLEWMDGQQTNLGKLAQDIRAALPEGKTLKISCHAYGAYRFPINDMKYVDGFTFQQYGPQKNWYDLSGYKNAYQNFVNYGFPKDKIYLSYSSTTSGPYNESGNSGGANISGWANLINTTPYEPSEDMGLRRILMNGVYYYYMSPEQVYQKAKFAVDHNAQGIFYWDMGNDISPKEDYCLAKYCSYGLNSNVDSLVTSVNINYPTSIEDVTSDADLVEIRYNAARNELQAGNGSRNVGLQVYSMDGKLVASSTGRILNVGSLAKGIYVAHTTAHQGKSKGLVFIKK